MFCVINVTVLFLTKRTKNVPQHILAPAAVACDTYLVRRSAHPERSVCCILGKDFPNIQQSTLCIVPYKNQHKECFFFTFRIPYKPDLQ